VVKVQLVKANKATIVATFLKLAGFYAIIMMANLGICRIIGSL
jgi:hypothetical protein